MIYTNYNVFKIPCNIVAFLQHQGCAKHCLTDTFCCESQCDDLVKGSRKWFLTCVLLHVLKLIATDGRCLPYF